MDSDQALYSVSSGHIWDQLFADCGAALGVPGYGPLQDTSAVLSFIHQAGPCIAHHLSDATGQHLHLPVGQGS